MGAAEARAMEAKATCERRRVTEASIVTELEKDQDPVVQITVVQRRNPILILFTLALKICRFQFCFCLERLSVDWIDPID